MNNFISFLLFGHKTATIGQLHPYIQERQVREMAVFECEVNEILMWSFQGFYVSLHGAPLPQHIEVGKLNSNKHLIRIRNVRKNDAGTYKCFGVQDGVYKESLGTLLVGKI